MKGGSVVEMLCRAGLSNALSATLLALLVACLGRVFSRRPALMHCLWLLVLLKLITPPLFEVPIPWAGQLAGLDAGQLEPIVMKVEKLDAPEPALASDASAVLDSVVARAYLPPHRRALLEPEFGAERSASHPLLGSQTLVVNWPRIGVAVWLFGSAIALLVSAWRIIRFQLMLREAEPVAEEMQDRVDELALKLGVATSPSVWWISGVLSPMVWAVGGRPRLLIPVDFWKSLDERQRSTVLAHELAHLCRGDHLVRYLELAITALYWWNPVAWAVRRALRAVEEQCCDAWVVWAFPDAAKAYAETLIETIDFLNRSGPCEPLLASGFGRVRHLRKRLTMIMNGTTPRRLGTGGTLGALALGLLLLPVNASLAQKADEKKDVRVVVVDDAGAILTDDIKGVDLVADDAGFGLAFGSAINADGKEEVHVEIRSDDQGTSVKAGSMDEAIAKLKAQIDTLKKKDDPSKRDKVLIGALERAVKGLESASRGTPDPKAPPTAARSVVVVRDLIKKDGADDKQSAETKAEIEKARKQVQDLSQALAAKQRELNDARVRLRRLEVGSIERTHARALTNARVVIRDGRAAQRGDGKTSDDSKDKGKDKDMVRELVTRAPGRPGMLLESRIDQRRIDDLEKKLDRLLEEVSRLKKDRDR
jgi:bla regulator protein blaR1